MGISYGIYGIRPTMPNPAVKMCLLAWEPRWFVIGTDIFSPMAMKKWCWTIKKMQPATLPSAGHSWVPNPFVSTPARPWSWQGTNEFLFQTYRDHMKAPMNELLKPQCLRCLRLPKSCFKLFQPSNWDVVIYLVLGGSSNRNDVQIWTWLYPNLYINNPNCTPISRDSTNTKQACYPWIFPIIWLLNYVPMMFPYVPMFS